MDNGTYRWADPVKHPTEEQWAVPLPPEEVTTPMEKVALVDRLDESWAAAEAPLPLDGKPGPEPIEEPVTLKMGK
jgi:hypothetical protein